MAKPVEAKVRVVDVKGNPLSRVGLSVKISKPKGGGSWSGSLDTNEKGEVTISPLHPTWEYHVTAKAKQGFVATKARLIQGEMAVLKMEPGCVVRGKLLDFDGNPVADRRVRAIAEKVDLSRPDRSYVDADRHTDDEGRFEFTRLPKGEFKILSNKAEEVIVEAGVDTEPIELWLEE